MASSAYCLFGFLGSIEKNQRNGEWIIEYFDRVQKYYNKGII
jgi:hypothetical protein